MRITLLSLLFVVIFSAGAKAQDDDLDYYINASGQKIEGVISLNYANDFIYYKPTKETRKDTKVLISDIKMVVVNQHTKKESYVDTLCVVADGTSKDQKKYFGKLALASPGMHIYYKSKDIPQLPTYTIRYTTAAAMQAQNGVGQWEMGQGGEKLTPMYQENGGNVTYELTNKNFIEILSKAVADYPDLAEQIQNKTYKFKEIGKIFTQYRERNN
jgi:hypothetical protein